MSSAHTHNEIKLELPAYARVVIELFEEAGFETWAVGGWVRDALRGLPSHDIDLCSSAPWQTSAKLARAAGYQVYETGTKHGSITIISDGQALELTTFRRESSYSDHRHPDQVEFVTSCEEDLARRDFTINAMAYHPDRGLLDCFGGQEDLAQGLIRCVGNPERRFREDALRLLRALRFAARMDFELEFHTEEALRQQASSIAEVAAPRIGHELDGLISSGRAARMFRTYFDLFAAAIPELAPLKAFDQCSPYHSFAVDEHTARVMAAVEAFSGGCASPELRWAALLHDIAKPACFSKDIHGRGHFFGHPEQGVLLAKKILDRLALPKERIRYIVQLVRYHDVTIPHERTAVLDMLRVLHGGLFHAQKLSGADMARLFCCAHELICLRKADASAKAVGCWDFALELDQLDDVLAKCLYGGDAFSTVQLMLSGKDLMFELGLEPGREIKHMLERLLFAHMEGELANNREDLLSFARKFCASKQQEHELHNSKSMSSKIMPKKV